MHSGESGSEHLRSLGARLVLATLGFCFVFTVLTVVVRTYFAWQEAWGAMHADLRLLEQVYRQTLSKAIWEMDREALAAHVDSAAQVSSVGQVRLKLRSTPRNPEVLERTAEQWLPSTLAPVLHVDLVYVPYPGALETVGELTLAGDERLLWRRLRAELRGIVATQLLQSLLLAGLIMWLFNRAVTVHVQNIARHLAQITPDNLRQGLHLARNPHVRDELSLLEHGVNALQDKLAQHLQQLHRYEAELGTHRDHLAALVRARTGELESLTQAQQLVLGLSNRLIHTPHDAFAQCQRDCVIEVARRMGACYALWLVPSLGGGAFRLHVQWGQHPADAAQAWTPLALEGLTQTPARLVDERLLFFIARPS